MLSLPSSRCLKLAIHAFLLRLIPIIVLSFFQSPLTSQISLTDVDYKVYSDAALRYSSPYQRHTYRYTPFISWMMLGNQLYQHAGKILFALFDAGAVIALWYAIRGRNQENKTMNNNANAEQQLHLNSSNPTQKKIQKANDNSNPQSYAQLSAMAYAYNPLFIYLTVRGSCESVSMLLMYLFYALLYPNSNIHPSPLTSNKFIRYSAYALYGLWVHVRIYPIIFLPGMIMQQYRWKGSKEALRMFIELGLLAGGVFLGLAAIFYCMYGMPFLQESYFYHFIRKDNRHSFSPYFYQIYLNLTTSTPTRSFMRSLPLIILILSLSFTHSKKLSPSYLHFLLVFCFVTFNTVITLQYYMWIIGALLMVLPQSIIFTLKKYRKLVGYGFQYFLFIFIWIWLSLQLEGKGDNNFMVMWFICLVKVGIDVWVLRGLMATIRKPTDQELKRNALSQMQKVIGKGKSI